MQHDGCWQLTTAVNPNKENVFGIKLEIQPRPAIRNDARRKEQLARRMRFTFIMVKEHPRAAVHLRHNHPLRPVHDKSAVLGHKGQVAHVNFLFFNIFDRARACFFIHIEDNET